jgi:outer membrane PBP1 activator LpoA protein
MSLAACSTLPDKEAGKQAEEKSDSSEQQQPTETKALSLDDYLQLRSQAAEQGNWAEYLLQSENAWQLSSNTQKPEIEEQAWSIVRSLSIIEQDKLANHSEASVQAWHLLFRLFNDFNINQQTSLLDLNSYYKDSIFHNHLLNRLLADKPDQTEIKQIAVLLPMQGKFKVVSQQIRNGIIKAFYASEQDLEIRFYDSSNLSELENIYTQAKQDGADRIIGPLRKEAVQNLASFHDQTMLLLNSIENSNVDRFSFKSADPNQQMSYRFKAMGIKRLGILSSDKTKNFVKAQQLKGLWEQQPGNTAEISNYPDLRPKLRAALGKLIHEHNSKERHNNLRWAINEKLEFFPRTRKDLDAIVIFDDANRMAVFRPQFDFFQLDMPLFSDSSISPKKLQKQAVNKDLKGIEFLSYPAVLMPEDLNSVFEAFGWDSFLVTTHLKQLKNGSCLTNAKTGILSMDGPEVRQQQIWLTYQNNGQLVRAPKVVMPVNEVENDLTQQTATNVLPESASIDQTRSQSPVEKFVDLQAAPKATNLE